MALPFVVPELERIWLLLQHHRYGLAEDAARRRLAINPADWQAYVLLTHALRFLDRLAEARITATNAVSFAPQSASAHFVLAQVCGQQGFFEEAHAATIEALRLNPSQAEYHGFRAQLFYLRGSYNAAISCAEDGLRFNARHADCLLWRALAQEAKDRPEAADADFRRLLHLAPNSYLLHRQLGRVMLQRYEPHQADMHLTTALRQEPEEAAELIPLIQKARRQATWPSWLLRGCRHEASERALGLEGGMRMAFFKVAIGMLSLRTWWLTRHDPVFQLSRAQVWQRRLALWLSSILLLPILLLLGDYFGFFDASKPFTMPQMIGMLVGNTLFLFVAWLIKRQIDA